jgi:hypothetical protein
MLYGLPGGFCRAMGPPATASSCNCWDPVVAESAAIRPVI